MSPAGPLAVLLAALAASGCVSAAGIRDDLREGRTRGAYLAEVPFEPQRPGHCGPSALSSLLRHWGRKDTQEEIGRETYSPSIRGTLGFDLWRYARRPAGLAAVQSSGTPQGLVDALLAQGVPVILNLGLKAGGPQHFVLAVGHDRDRRLWILQDGRVADRVVSEAWLMRRWEPTRHWALVAFPPERPVRDLGAAFHVQLADRTDELGCREAALGHLEEAKRDGGADAEAWTGIGRLERRFGRAAEAEAAWRTAIRLAPERPDAMNNLAMLLAETPSRLEEAEGLAREAAGRCAADRALASRLPYVLDTLGVVLQRRGRDEEARKVLEAALRAAPPGSPLDAEIREHLATIRE